MIFFTLRRFARRCTKGVAIIIAALLSTHAPINAKQAPQLVMILDASASMEDKLTNELKYKLVRKAMGDALPAYGGKLRAGLITFGRNTKNSCKDISRLVAFKTPQTNRLCQRHQQYQTKRQKPYWRLTGRRR